MRYDDEDAEDFKNQIGLGSGSKKKRSKAELLKWFFTIDIKDWTNYLALLLTFLLIWLAYYNIIQILSPGG